MGPLPGGTADPDCQNTGETLPARLTVADAAGMISDIEFKGFVIPESGLTAGLLLAAGVGIVLLGSRLYLWILKRVYDRRY